MHGDPGMGVSSRREVSFELDLDFEYLGFLRSFGRRAGCVDLELDVMEVADCL